VDRRADAEEHLDSTHDAASAARRPIALEKTEKDKGEAGSSRDTANKETCLHV
jgi:hypothetical protein